MTFRYIIDILYWLSPLGVYNVAKINIFTRLFIAALYTYIIVDFCLWIPLFFTKPRAILAALTFLALKHCLIAAFVYGYYLYIKMKKSYDSARNVAREYILGIRQSPYSHAPYESEFNKDVKRIIELEAQLEEATRRADETEQRAVKAEELYASCRDGHGLCSIVLQMRRDGKTDEEIAKHLKTSGLSIPQIGALLHTSPYVSNSARVKHAQRLLGVS